MRDELVSCRTAEFTRSNLLKLSLLVFLTFLSFSIFAGGLIPAPGVSPELAELAETGAVSQVTELSNRRRLTTFFANEQSPFYGVQLNYVNVGRGNLTFLNRDLVRADHVPIVFGRVYDSHKTTANDFGPGWKLSVAEFMQLRGGKLLYVDASGSQYELTIDGGRILSAHPHLTGISEGRFRWDAVELRHGGLQKKFERAGNGYRLAEVHDGAGGSLRLRYKADLVERIWTSHLRFVDLTRDGQGRIVAARDDAGRRVAYDYDAKGRLVAVVDLGGQRWQIGYDAEGRLAHVTDPRGAAALQATFDGSGRAQQVHVLYDSMSFEYQPGQTTVSSALQQSAVLWQDASGLTRAAKDFAGELTEIEFDAELQPIGLSFNGTRIAEIGYDDDHRLQAVNELSQANSQLTTFEYDASGRLLGAVRNGTSLKRYRYDPLGKVTSAADEDGARTYTYLANRLKGIKVGKTTLELETNELGQLTRFSSAEQRVAIDYDRQDRVQSVRYTMANADSHSRYDYSTQGLRTRGSYVFRARRPNEPVRHLNATLALGYDAVGNLTGLHQEAEGKTLLSQSYLLGDKNQLQRLTTNGRPMDYEYNAAGGIAQIRIDGRVAAFEYDELGRLSGTRLNGRQLVTSDYGPMDLDVAAEADSYSPFTAISTPTASATFGSLDAIAYARTRGTPFGPVRFEASMGRFVLAKSLLSAPDAVLLASLRRRALPIGYGGHHDYGKKAPTTVNAAPIGFDKPSNGLFVPPEFSSLNCYQCQAGITSAVLEVNGSAAATANVSVGAATSILVYDPSYSSTCQVIIVPEFGGYIEMPPEVSASFGDGNSTQGFLFGQAFSHTYSAPGQYSLQTTASCTWCAGPQFIRVDTATINACSETAALNPPPNATPPPFTHQSLVNNGASWGQTTITYTDSLVCTQICRSGQPAFRLEGDFNVSKQILISTAVPANGTCSTSVRTSANINHTETHELVHANAVLGAINGWKSQIGLEYPSLGICNAALSSLRSLVANSYSQELARQGGHQDHAGERRHSAVCPVTNGSAQEIICGLGGWQCQPYGNFYPGP